MCPGGVGQTPTTSAGGAYSVERPLCNILLQCGGDARVRGGADTLEDTVAGVSCIAAAWVGRPDSHFVRTLYHSLQHHSPHYLLPMLQAIQLGTAQHSSTATAPTAAATVATATAAAAPAGQPAPSVAGAAEAEQPGAGQGGSNAVGSGGSGGGLVQQGRVIEGAGHACAGHEEEVVAAVCEFLAHLPHSV